ncbi:MAG: hypothetical protein Ct9H90mP20_7020 [Candidatus Neomarinimicrobiota bacterium]|nr:MAG: hypothetical protein Ct9H90mP20_7020 [Candidatus Neomarinimicrobiota bacterium]
MMVITEKYNVDWPRFGVKPIGNAVSILKYVDVDYESRGGAGIAYRGKIFLTALFLPA